MDETILRSTLLQQQLQEAEFKYWDACRNCCSLATLNEMEEHIKELKRQAVSKGALHTIYFDNE